MSAFKDKKLHDNNMLREIKLLRRYAAGERNFSGENFSGIVFRSLPYKKIDLSEADFSNANFENANLNRVNMTNCDLYNSNFKNVDLSQSNLSGSNLTNTNLSFSNIIDANLSSTKLTKVNFTQANLNNANLTNADLDSANLKQANLTNTNFIRAKLFRTNFTNAINPPYTISIFENSTDNPNVKLLRKVRESCKEILYENSSYRNQNNCPYGIFLWETATMGEFSLEELLKVFGCLREIDSNIFIAGTSEQSKLLYPGVTFFNESDEILEVVYSFRNLYHQIEKFLVNIEIFQVMNGIYMFLGTTLSGDYLGVAYQRNYWYEDTKGSNFRFVELQR